MKKNYVQAILQLLREGKDIDTVLSSLSTTLHKKGHQKLHEGILSDVSVELVRNEAQKGAQITLARATDMEAYQNAIQDALTQLHAAQAPVRTVVDPTLIGGFTAEYANTRIDRSYKEKLVSLYRSITK